MTEDDAQTLSRLRERLEIQLAEPVAFDRVSPGATAAKVRLLTAAAIYFNILAVTEFGGRPGPVRQEGLVEQVVAAAFQTYAGQGPHPSPFDKSAMLLRGITQGHPFTYGNKRTGFLLATFFLDRVGFGLRPRLSQPNVVEFCRQVSAGEIRDLETIAATLQGWTVPRQEQHTPSR